jgi:hypothetical protein
MSVCTALMSPEMTAELDGAMTGIFATAVAELPLGAGVLDEHAKQKPETKINKT